MALVEKSINKARWVMPDVSLDRVEHIARQYDLPEIIARFLCARHLDQYDISSFLNPTLKNDFPDPFALKGMGDMAEDLAIAIEDQKSIAIFGDFDVDGATSSAILYRFLKGLGYECPVYIPDRMEEGYGPNIAALQSLKEQGANIVFILDCGTTAFDIIKAGTELGLKIVILDHHEAEETLPECWHVINPKRKDDSSGLDMLAAVGVTFLACVAMNNRLRDRGFYRKTGKSEPNLKSFMDLLALGTVCDMVPLKGPNRLFVKTGLTTPYESLNPGIKALMQVSSTNAPISTYDCGFILGPRINAGSRIHEADLGAKLLCSDDEALCQNIAWTLNDCNEQRKSIQKDMESQAIEMIEKSSMQDEPIILVDDERWHPGLSGLVAGRLKERYHKPCCVVTYVHDAHGYMEGRGSGRSVPGIHIAQSFIDARAEELLEKGGGHAMAGGFTVLPEKMDDLRNFLKQHVKTQMDNVESNVETRIDSIITAGGSTVELIELLQNHIGPFGQEHPEGLFMLQNIRIHSCDIMGQSHIRAMISDWEGGTRLKGVAFGAVDTPLGDALLKNNGKALHIVGHLKVNEWQGRKTPEIHIMDAVYASPEE